MIYKKYKHQIFLVLTAIVAFSIPASSSNAALDADSSRLPADVITNQSVQLSGTTLSFTATAGSIRLRDGKDSPLADIAFTAYQTEGPDAISRPVAFVFNGGPGMASAWLQMGALGPWRVQFDPASDGPSASAVPVTNADTWLDFTDLVFVDPPATGYSRIVTSDADSRRRLLSVSGDIDALGGRDPPLAGSQRPAHLTHIYRRRKLRRISWAPAGAKAGVGS